MRQGPPPDPRRSELIVAACFAVATVAGLGLAVVYVLGGQPQAEGALLVLSLGGLGVGAVAFARFFLPDEEATQEREPLWTPPEEERRMEESVARGGELIGRRPLLVRMLGAAAGALGLAALFPIRSLGPDPGRSLFRTGWREGSRVVRTDGTPVHVDDLATGGFITVFPEGATERSDSQTLLIRVDAERFRPRPGREDWAVDGYVAYSKICTHAGCPVGLYQAGSNQLLCPCHQSTFDALDGARPIFGPATRSLPQLPLTVDEEGYLRARGDYPEAVGPAFWGGP